MKKWKKYLIGLGILMTLSGSSVLANAEEIYNPQPGDVVDGSVLTLEDSSTGYLQQKARGTYFCSGSSRIARVNTNTANISGQTACYVVCDTVGCDIYLQRLVNGVWKQYALLPVLKYNVGSAYGYGDYWVSSGSYYRTRSYHYVRENGSYESGISYTSGLYFG